MELLIGMFILFFVVPMWLLGVNLLFEPAELYTTPRELGNMVDSHKHSRSGQGTSW